MLWAGEQQTDHDDHNACCRRWYTISAPSRATMRWRCGWRAAKLSSVAAQSAYGWTLTSWPSPPARCSSRWAFGRFCAVKQLHTWTPVYASWRMSLENSVQAVLEGAAAEGRAVAGTEVRVALDLRDRFGNVSASRSEQHVAVEATGACTAPFEEFTTDSFRCVVAGPPRDALPLALQAAIWRSGWPLVMLEHAIEST